MAVYYNTNRKYVVKTTKGENMKVSFLLKTALFQGIAPQELETLLPRLRMHKEQFSKGAIIYHAGERIRELGIVVSGRIQIETYDLWGNRSVLDSIGPKTIFAETYACLPDEVMLVTVSASEDSEVYFLDAHAMIKAASTHPALIQNLLTLTAQKNLNLSRRIFHTSAKTIRARLQSYLSFEATRQHSNDFYLPFNRQQLADYLSVDRSALSNELSKMQKEGYLRIHKNHVIFPKTKTR